MIKRKKRTNQVVVQTGPNWNDHRLDKGRVFVSVFEGRITSGEINKGHIKDYPQAYLGSLHLADLFSRKATVF